MTNSKVNNDYGFTQLSNKQLMNVEGSWSWRGALGGMVSGGGIAAIPGLITGPMDPNAIGMGASAGFIKGGMGN